MRHLSLPAERTDVSPSDLLRKQEGAAEARRGLRSDQVSLPGEQSLAVEPSAGWACAFGWLQQSVVLEAGSCSSLLSLRPREATSCSGSAGPGSLRWLVISPQLPVLRSACCLQPSPR